MQLVDVDVIGLQALQTGIDCRENALAIQRVRASAQIIDL